MRTAWALLVVTGLLLVGGGARLAWIEFEQGPALRARAARQQTVSYSIPAQRGEILDSRGRVLAGSIRTPSVFMDPGVIQNARFAAFSYGPVLGRDPQALQQEIVAARARGSRFLWVRRDLTPDMLSAFERVRQARGLGGFVVRYEPKRFYPYGRTAAHVLGYVGPPPPPKAGETGALPAQYGWAGVEFAFNDVLQGTPGRRTVTVDVRRRRLDSRPEAYTPPRDGAGVVLTLDVHLQQLTEQQLAAAVTEHNAKWGVAVVVDPQSGEVLAMASVPGFDPDEPFPRGVERDDPAFKAAEAAQRNRAIADSYEPGSIFKPFIAAAALQDGFFALDEVFEINGRTRYFGRRPISDTHAYAELTGAQIISKSSNIGMSLIGDRVGNARLHAYVRRFGFGTPTGSALPGEHPGQVQALDDWDTYSTHSVTYGQELAATPLQLVAAFSTFCNGGVLIQPRVVRGVLAPDGAVLEDRSTPRVVRQVLEPAIAERFRREALAAVVAADGTGRNAVRDDYRLFGKTGTAEIAVNGSYAESDFVGSFLCGGPVDVPRVVVLVSLYKPQPQHYGGLVAAPAASEIAAATLAYLRVPPAPAAPTP